MAIVAARFLYIAIVDLSHDLYRKVDVGAMHTIHKFILLLVGVGTVLLVI